MFSSFNKKITRSALKPFLKKYSTDEKILDVGAGKRKNDNHSYEEFFPNRFTVDIDPDREPDVVGDIHKLPFPDESETFVLCTEVLEHCHSPWIAASELKRVLKKGGKLILTTRFTYPLHSVPEDYFRYTKYGLRRLFPESEWKLIELTAETKTFSALAALTQRVGFQTLLKGGVFTKGCVYLIAQILHRLNWLIKSEYGNIERTAPDSDILTTGYYLVVEKK